MSASTEVEGYRLSAQQRRLWRHIESGRPTWAQARIRIDGPLDRARLSRAIDDVVARNEILHSSYVLVTGLRTPVQIVRPVGRTPVPAVDVRQLEERQQRDRIDAVAAAHRGEPIDVRGASVLRLTLFALGGERHELVVTTTVLAADGPTLRLFARELAASYQKAGQPGEALAHSQFAQWQQDNADDAAAASLVRGEVAPVAVHFPLRRGSLANPAVAVVDTTLPAAVWSAVDDFARRAGVRPEAVLLGGLQVLLWRITEQPVISVGTWFECRAYPELTDCFGHLSKWLVVDAEPGPSAAFAEVVAAADARLGAVEEVEEYLAEPYASGVPGWDVSFVCERPEVPLPADGVTFALASADVEDEPYELKLTCVLGESVSWHFRADRFGGRYVEILHEQYHTLLVRLLAEPSTGIGMINALESKTPAAQEVPPDGHVLHELFEEQVRRSPDATAVVFGERGVSYRELNRDANRVARRLVAGGIGPESLVGVCVTPSYVLLVAVLAVLKAGAAYLPLDPLQPVHRLRTLLAGASCRLVLRDQDVDLGVEHVDLPAEPDVSDGSDLPSVVRPDNLAYAMFTSGSTGVPKCVLMPHRGAANYLRWSAETYAAADGRGALVHSSIAFDLTVTSLYVPLLTGRTVWIDPAWQDISALSSELADRAGLDLLKLTPSHLKVLSATMTPADVAGTAANLVVGGEALTGQVVRWWRQHAPETKIFNEYGPTEAAVGCCVQECVGQPEEGPLPIGRPIANATMHVLDVRLRPVPVGMPGELYIGGQGLARGYLDDPGTSAVRFVADPFAASPGGRLYRTGDLGYRGVDGELYFLRRADQQVKINGVRVEPEETRAVLGRHPAVREAVVVAQPDGDGEHHLEAYVVPVDPAGTVDLMPYLRDELPAHLVPRSCRWVSTIPLTSNGKQDLAALAAGAGRTCAAQPPRDAVELGLVAIFEDLLSSRPIGVDEDFFGLGGHSVLAVRLIAKVNSAFHLRLPLAVLFDGPRATTAAGLAALVREQGVGERDDCLVRMGGGADGPALYCVHPAGGDVLGFRELSSSPATRRPLYGLQAPPWHDTSVPDLAAHYVARILDLQPRGPYPLLGWSMGGLVALEMAQRLTASGHEVPMLVLVESYFTERTDAAALLTHFVANLSAMAGADIVVDHVGLSLPAGIDAIFDAAARAGFHPSASERDQLAGRLLLTHAHSVAAERFEPRSYLGPVTLVQAADQPPALRRAASSRWRSLCPGLTAVRTIPGDHLSLFHQPFVNELAQLVDNALTAYRG